jgi:hypothetical protein|tara:strand:+ start:299 stop:511 length:213 start_codon:yes stop_codon:yes gene_type:complete
MTKARARERAKAKAKSGQKAKKQDETTEHPGQKNRPGQFDPGSGTIKSPGASANTQNFAEARRGGAARSR